MQNRRTILITGAAGNLGSLLSRQLVPTGHDLRLMYHRTPLPDDLARVANVRPIKADLGDPATLPAAVTGADVIVHFAGRLFAPQPISVHARTRLEEERLLLERTQNTGTSPVVLPLGMIYGRGILMIEAARWLARRRLLCVWREPTLFQLLSTADFLRAVEAAIFKPGVRGIYHVGDEQPVTLQEFLDKACRVWGYQPPVRIPFSMICCIRRSKRDSQLFDRTILMIHSLKTSAR